MKRWLHGCGRPLSMPSRMLAARALAPRKKRPDVAPGWRLVLPRPFICSATVRVSSARRPERTSRRLLQGFPVTVVCFGCIFDTVGHVPSPASWLSATSETLQRAGSAFCEPSLRSDCASGNTSRKASSGIAGDKALDLSRPLGSYAISSPSTEQRPRKVTRKECDHFRMLIVSVGNCADLDVVPGVTNTTILILPLRDGLRDSDGRPLAGRISEGL